MKTISLRQFRTSIADLTEPVQVVKREGDHLVTLGTWHPDVDEVIIRATVAGFGEPRPAPKPKR